MMIFALEIESDQRYTLDFHGDLSFVGDLVDEWSRWGFETERPDFLVEEPREIDRTFEDAAAATFFKFDKAKRARERLQMEHLD